MEKLQKHKHLIILICVILLAAFLRLYRIADYMTFLGDEGRDALVVYNILHGKFTLLGPTASVGGFFMGPIYYYFMAPFFWLFNYSPEGPAVMVALFGIATVWLVYKVGSEFFNRQAGLIAASLYTISPVVIGYSRSSWNPNLMPFFSLLILYVLYLGVKENKKKLFIIVGFLFGIAMQLHYISTFLGVILASYIVITQFVGIYGSLFKKIKSILYKYMLVFTGFLVGFSPFLAFEVRHEFLNIQSIFKFIFYSGNTGGNTEIFPILGNSLIRLFGRLVMKFPPVESIFEPNAFFYIDTFTAPILLPFIYWLALTLCLAVLSLVLFGWQYIKAVKKNEKFSQLSIIFLWFIIGIGLFGFYKKPIYDYYFAFMFPLPFLLIGNAFSFLWQQKKLFKTFSVILLFFIILVNLQGVPFRFPANRQLKQAETIARFVYEKAEGKPFNFALITGGNSDHAYRYFFTVWNNPPVTIENLQKDPEQTLVTDQLFVVCESLPCSPLGHSLWEIAGFGRAEIAGEWDVSVVKIYKLIHYKGN